MVEEEEKVPQVFENVESMGDPDYVIRNGEYSEIDAAKHIFDKNKESRDRDRSPIDDATLGEETPVVAR